MRCGAGNHQHAVVHSTCVLEQQPDNVKALYRRGACQVTTPSLPRRPLLSVHTHTHTRRLLRLQLPSLTAYYPTFPSLTFPHLTPPSLTSPHLTPPLQLRLGYLEKARADLQRAVKLAPANAEARAELLACNARLAEYRERRKQLSKRMLAGADGGVVEEAAPSGEETGA